jgi:hypothetical protein
LSEAAFILISTFFGPESGVAIDQFEILEARRGQLRLLSLEFAQASGIGSIDRSAPDPGHSTSPGHDFNDQIFPFRKSRRIELVVTGSSSGKKWPAFTDRARKSGK